MEEKKKISKKFILIISTLLIVGVVYGGYKYIHSLAHETTEDAQIQVNMVPVAPHVSGYIQAVLVSDNQYVEKGDTLFIINPQDYQVQLEKAKANVLMAESRLLVEKASVQSAKANASASLASVNSATQRIANAKISVERATDDFERYQNLYANHSITAQQFEKAKANMQKAENKLEAVVSQKVATANKSEVAVSQTGITQKKIAVAQASLAIAKSQLSAAKLQMGYTIVTAPFSGQLSSVKLLSGQFVSPGQSLFYLVNTQNKWVVANFKETQITKMQIGQKVSVEVDAYPDVEFHGVIKAFSPATGARFSLLPPNNATGNFVKTVQRLPVKITFTEDNQAKQLHDLRSGMNVLVDVHLQ